MKRFRILSWRPKLLKGLRRLNGKKSSRLKLFSKEQKLAAAKGDLGRVTLGGMITNSLQE